MLYYMYDNEVKVAVICMKMRHSEITPLGSSGLSVVARLKGIPVRLHGHSIAQQGHVEKELCTGLVCCGDVCHVTVGQFRGVMTGNMYEV